MFVALTTVPEISAGDIENPLDSWEFYLYYYHNIIRAKVKQKPMARYKSGHHDATHSAIVAKASGMIRERGLDGASVVEVMKSAGLTHGGFYAHFKGKTAMLTEAMAEAIKPSAPRFRMLAGLAKDKGDPGLIAQRYLSDERVAEVAGGCAAAALSSEVRRAPLPVREAFQSGAQATAEALESTFPDIPDAPGQGAWAVYAMLVGALALMRAVPDDATREAIRSQTVATLRRLGAKETSTA
jgi:TetR/AcrR family transcriptional regulator, transcriptional repressor for nem operon